MLEPAHTFLVVPIPGPLQLKVTHIRMRINTYPTITKERHRPTPNHLFLKLALSSQNEQVLANDPNYLSLVLVLVE